MVASVASTVETAAGTSRASMTISLRSTASETAPAKAPNKSCGSCRAATTPVDRQRRARDLEGEQAGGQQLQPAHGVGEGADQPQPQEIGLAQQLSHRGTLVPSARLFGEFIVVHAIAADMCGQPNPPEEGE